MKLKEPAEIPSLPYFVYYSKGVLIFASIVMGVPLAVSIFFMARFSPTLQWESFFKAMIVAGPIALLCAWRLSLMLWRVYFNVPYIALLPQGISLYNSTQLLPWRYISSAKATSISMVGGHASAAVPVILIKLQAGQLREDWPKAYRYWISKRYLKNRLDYFKAVPDNAEIKLPDKGISINPGALAKIITHYAGKANAA
jgi:hypothetical protein